MNPSAHRSMLRALALLLSYPDLELREFLPELRRLNVFEPVLSAPACAALDALIDELLEADAYQVEADYVDCFDRGRRTSLHLFEHVHGDSRDRGPAMIDLLQTYRSAGLELAPGELPDYLPAIIEFASTQPDALAREFVAEMAHVLNALHAALERRGSRHAAAVAALLEYAGAPVHPVEVAAEEPLDATWAEPEAFGGCDSRGAARADAARPVQIVRRAARPESQPGARP